MSENKLFTPKKSFFELPIVIWTGIGVLLLVAIISFIIWFYGDYGLCGTGECFNIFVSEFKFPLALLTLLIPIGAIYAAQHRSELTIAQIKATEDHNNFMNHYKHIEEFEKFIDNKNLKNNIKDTRALHNTLFPECRNGMLTTPKNIHDDLLKCFISIYKALVSLEDTKWSAYDDNYNLAHQELIKHIEKINRLSGNLSDNYHVIFIPIPCGLQRKSPLVPKPSLSGSDVISLMPIEACIKNLVRTLNVICSFSSNYKKPIVSVALEKMCCNKKYFNLKSKLSFNLQVLDNDCKGQGEEAVKKQIEKLFPIPVVKTEI